MHICVICGVLRSYESKRTSLEDVDASFAHLSVLRSFEFHRT